ncbi:DUF2871 domain-containing protein [Saccharopolyspora hattusasensis]|uniref:DUF2871 domain-containing protein n=1 Tax=Saccharopolyspora hattusasensis TaxID=1128679 RepID=UPI003D999097
MKKLYWSALIYMILGLAAGLYYREFTKALDFTGDTELSVLHTHPLALGMLFFLVVLALDKAFALSGNKLFTLFFWFYNSGLALTTAMMLVHGTLTVLGEESSAAISGIAGLGHILITLGLIHLFLSLRKSLPDAKEESEQRTEALR